jgi:hypothetical protein
MLEELRQTFEGRGFLEGSHSEPGHFVIERRSSSAEPRVRARRSPGDAKHRPAHGRVSPVTLTEAYRRACTAVGENTVAPAGWL